MKEAEEAKAKVIEQKKGGRGEKRAEETRKIAKKKPTEKPKNLPNRRRRKK